MTDTLTADRPLVDRAWEAQHSRPHDSHAWAREALAQAEASGDARAKAWALLTIGYYELRYASVEAARASLEAAHAQFAAGNDARGRVLASNGLARTLMMTRDPEGALAIFQGNLTEASEEVTTLDRFYTLNGIAGCLAALGDTPRALGYLFEALGQLRNINARPQMATLLSNLGAELVSVGDYEEAYRVLVECESISGELQHPRLLLTLRVHFADCLLQLGRDAEALAYARQILADPEAPHMSSPEGNVYATAAHVLLRNGRTDEAARVVELALEAARRHDSRTGLILALMVRALLESAGRRVVEAVATLQEARSLLEPRSPHLARCQVLERLAEELAACGRHAEAYAVQREFFAAYEKRLGLASRARYHAVQIRFELDRMRAERDALREQALRDPLTGLYNRRYLDSVLGDLLAVFARSRQPLAVAMLDLDHFKQVNDQFGHEAGNQVLKAVAAEIRHAIRASDLAARYGGDEFVVILTRTDLEGANRVAEAIRAGIEGVGRRLGYPVGHVTASIGVAEYDVGRPHEGDLLVQADRALYQAKSLGRNAVA